MHRSKDEVEDIFYDSSASIFLSYSLFMLCAHALFKLIFLNFYFKFCRYVRKIIRTRVYLSLKKCFKITNDR